MHLPAKKNILLKAAGIAFDAPTRKRKILSINQLEIFERECLFVLGENGAGKSTLLSILAGHMAPTEGKLWWKTRALPSVATLLVPGFKHVALVQQHPDLNPFFTADEVLEQSLRHLPEKSKIKKRKLLIQICRLQSILLQQTGNLSGGEKRRLAIAVALATEVELLLLDEPFADLDYPGKEMLFHLILELKEQTNTSLVIVSHQGADAQWLADGLLVLHHGRVVEKVYRSDLTFKPGKVQTARLLGVKNLIPAIWLNGTLTGETLGPQVWIHIPENAVSASPKEHWIAWRTFRKKASVRLHGMFLTIWENDRLFFHQRSEMPPPEVEETMLFINPLACQTLKT